MKTVITFGTFDVFHIGHVNILMRAKACGDRLIVGVSTDELNFSKKGRYPIYNQDDRQRIVSSLFCVDEVFFEETLEQKPEYIRRFDADILVMGDDWKGRFDNLMHLCNVKYFPRTQDVSTTAIIQTIKEMASHAN